MTCDYYPCHSGLTSFSCEFCYCPEYYTKECSGNPKWIRDKTGMLIKDCSNCIVNHTEEYVTSYYRRREMVKKLEIVSDGTPGGTVVKINDEVVSINSIVFAVAVDDLVATLEIEPTFESVGQGVKNG